MGAAWEAFTFKDNTKADRFMGAEKIVLMDTSSDRLEDRTRLVSPRLEGSLKEHRCAHYGIGDEFLICISSG